MDRVDEILADSGLLRNNDVAVQRPKECLLLTLPAELRNEIYTFVGAEEAKLQVKSKGAAPGILYVSRQVRSEFKAIYYSDKIMKAAVYDYESKLWRPMEDPEDLAAVLCHEEAEFFRQAFKKKTFKESAEKMYCTRAGTLGLAHDGFDRVWAFILRCNFRDLW